MSLEKAKNYVEKMGFGNRIREFESSSATVELAAIAVGTEPEHIAKSLTFKVGDEPIMIICAGDAKVNNQKYKGLFHTKAKMLSYEEVGQLIGHEVGGVCPFGINEGVKVYLENSLKRFEKIYPACGNAASAVELTPEELGQLVPEAEWIDVCKY